MSTCIRLVVFMIALGSAQAQSNIVANSRSGQISLSPHVAYVAFIPSNSNTDQEAVKNAAIGVAEGHAVTAAAARTLPIPVVGPIVGEFVVGKIMKRFHPEKPITGFNIAFVQGLSAGSILQRGETSFTIPAQALQGGNPVLVRVKISPKDSARIVRSVRASVKMANSQINPMATDTKILGIDQDVVSCRQEVQGENVVLTANSVLESGEYAVIIVPNQQDTVPVAGNSVWDFRVM